MAEPSKAAKRIDMQNCECGRPFTCFGEYEGNEAYSCDTCCGHGNEDGWCVPINDDTKLLISKLCRERAELREEREAAEKLYKILDEYGVDLEGIYFSKQKEREKEVREALAAYRKATGRE